MNIKYFHDTDTLLITFNNNEIVETKDLNDNVVYEIDKIGQLVAITIEHAKQIVQIDNFSYQKIADENLPLAA
ncbi:hypothetical protein MHK_004956 [Candidatus Magnetomorum sp. HK-1]|nr:hypothetical protein MHK_004956 [Candidatus Magnetomorum sp. HK-1]